MRCAVSRRSLACLFGGALLLGGLGLSGCSRTQDPWKDAKPGQLKVLATFPPLYCLTQAIAGDDAYVLCFLSSEGPHEYKFNPVDGVKVQGANLLIANGLGLDDKFVASIKGYKAVQTVKVGDELPDEMLRESADDDDDEPDAKGKPDAPHHHAGHDPHVWLGPPQAMVIADKIAAKLAEIDGRNREGYFKRAAQLKEELKKLQEYGRERFANKKSRKVLTMHDSFGYFAKAFGLDVAGSIQPQPDAPVDSGRLGQLAKRCGEKDIRVITYEPQYPKTQAELLQQHLKSKNLDVRVTEFDPLETATLDSGGVNPALSFYMEKMKANIDNLAKALP
jgi:ABC-type Zn uptake system ZnuABC Zn-binding protein ZnuA